MQMESLHSLVCRMAHHLDTPPVPVNEELSHDVRQLIVIIQTCTDPDAEGVMKELAVLDSTLRQRTTHHQLGTRNDEVCALLFECFERKALRPFVCGHVPGMVTSYLRAPVHLPGLETLLVAMNNRLAEESGETAAVFNPPSVKGPSVYSQPTPEPTTKSAILTEMALMNYENNQTPVALGTPPRPIETVNAVNRMPMLTTLIAWYNNYIACIDVDSLIEYCDMCIRLADVQTPPSVLSLSVPLLLEFLRGLMFCLHHPLCQAKAAQALTALHSRASHDLLPNVLLVTRSLLHLQAEADPG